MKIDVSVNKNGIVLIKVQDAVDVCSADGLHDALADLLAENHRRLAVDFSQVTYISSPGLRALVRAQDKARNLGGEVRLFGLSSFVLDVFQIAGFDKMFHIAGTLDKATADWRTPGDAKPPGQ